MLEYSSYAKKLPDKEFIHAIKQERYTSGSALDDNGSRMNLTWALVQPIKLFKVELCLMKAIQQKVPSWSGFSAMVLHAYPSFITDVGYCSV